MEIPVTRRQYISFLCTLLIPIGTATSAKALSPPVQATATTAQADQQPPAHPSATTDDGKFKVTVELCSRLKSRVECTLWIENKTGHALQLGFDSELLTDGTGVQIPAKFRNPHDPDHYPPDGGDWRETQILTLGSHLWVTRNFVFLDASEDSRSAGLSLGFDYGPDGPTRDADAGTEHLVLRNIPLLVRPARPTTRQ